MGWSKSLGNQAVDLITTGLRTEIRCTWNLIVRPELEFEKLKYNCLKSGVLNPLPIENFEDAFNAEEERIEKNWSPLYHYKTKGHYYQQLKRYIDLFPENQIKVIFFSVSFFL